MSNTYYKDLVVCEFCGHHTHGRYETDQPEVVYCTSCNKPILGNPAPDELEFDEGEYCAPI